MELMWRADLGASKMHCICMCFQKAIQYCLALLGAVKNDTPYKCSRPVVLEVIAMWCRGVLGLEVAGCSDLFDGGLW